MKKNNFLYILICLFLANVGYSQDIHFSQFQASPLLLNPASTGHFVGDYRAGLNYRNQWSSFIKPFVTYSGFFDKQFKKELLGNDFFGAGLVLFSDNAGTAEFSTQSALVSAGYHLKLGTDNKQVVSIGLQGGIVQKGINYEELKYGNQYENVFYNDELDSKEPNQENSIFYAVINGGLSYKYLYNEKLAFGAGLSFFNLNSPKESFYKESENVLNSRFSLNVDATYLYNEKISILPSLLVTGQSKANEFIVGSGVDYKVKNVPLMNISALFGVWYRSSDAIILVPGIQYNNYRFAFSYDINISSLKVASKSRGAFELSLIYIFNAIAPILLDTKYPPSSSASATKYISSTLEFRG